MLDAPPICEDRAALGWRLRSLCRVVFSIAGPFGLRTQVDRIAHYARWRRPDMAPNPSTYYRVNADTEDLQKTLGRLTGQNWVKATKIHAFSSADDDPDDD